MLAIFVNCEQRPGSALPINSVSCRTNASDPGGSNSTYIAKRHKGHPDPQSARYFLANFQHSPFRQPPLMIEHDRFVYIHFPKTGGMKLGEILGSIPGAVRNPYHHHFSIEDRKRADPGWEVGDRMVVVGFRRLPSWLLSRYSFEVHRSPHCHHDPALLEQGKFMEENGEQGYADLYAMRWISPDVYQHHNIKFLRQEHLASDFERIFSDLIDIHSIDLRSRVNNSNADIKGASMVALNQSKIYQNCPYWSGLEFIAYGNILSQL